MSKPSNMSPAEFQILLALADGAKHGHGIKVDVVDRTQGRIHMGPGTLYGAIKRLLRREWIEEMGPQKAYHFNAPVDISDRQLKELTVEIRRKIVDAKNNETYEWYRPGNARNELWDLLGYGYAAVEILAWNICIKYFVLRNKN